MAAKEHTAIRADVGVLARADALIPRMSSPGFEPKRSDVLRMALARGVASLEAEHGVTAPEPVKVAKRGRRAATKEGGST